MAERIAELVARINKQAEPRAIIAIEKAIERSGISKARVIEMLAEDRQDARQAGQYGASVRATELIGIELGMFVKRTDNKHTVERRFLQLSEEEQERVAGELLREAREVIAEQKRLAAERGEVPEAEWVEVAEGEGTQGDG